MHESTAMAKRKLISTPASYPGLSIIAISSTLRDYRLAYYINQAAGLELAKTDDLPVFMEREAKEYTYPLFACFESSLRTHYYLIGNNHTGGKMCPDYKHADYLLLLHSPEDNENATEMMANVKKIAGIQLAIQADLSKIRNLEGLMNDLELHLVKKG